jgi:phage terminase large subunit-like protein
LRGYRPRNTEAEVRFSAAKALKACRFFHTELNHVKGEKAGTPFYLEPWQQAVIGCLFGYSIRRDGAWRRRYREVLVYVPRKNGKTPLAAGILLYGLFEDGEPCAELYGAAGEYKQASLVFEHARGMVLQNARLAELSKVYRGASKAIQLVKDYSTYRVISAEAYSSHGYNTHMAVVDELHTQPTRDLVDTLVTSTGARQNPVVVYLTTADYIREGSVCNEKRRHADRVRSGDLDDPGFLPVLYETPADADWEDTEVWESANPNLGVSLSREFLARECLRAKETPTFLNTFLRLHLNVQTEQDCRWLPLRAWDSTGEAFDPESLRGARCYCGLDLASTQDTTAFVMAFPTGDENYLLVPHFWVPRETARKRSERENVGYLAWEQQGLLTFTEGNICDYNVVRRDIVGLSKRHKLQEIAYDPWNARHLVQQLQDEDGLPMIEFRQGYVTMSPACKEFERLVHQGRIHHGGHAMLRWQVGNIAVRMDPAGNIKLDKARSGDRIDGVVCAVMAVHRAAANMRRTSVYENRGVRTL